MGSFIDKTGKTVDLAIADALTELNLSADDVVIEVLDEGESGGLLGFGKKPARIRVYYGEDFTDDDFTRQDSGAKMDAGQEALAAESKEERAEDKGLKQEIPDLELAENAALDYLQMVLSGLGLHGRISSWLDDEANLHFEVDGEDLGTAIGRRGETMEAIQYLTNLVANRDTEAHIRIVIDIGGYRQRRDEKLKEMALRSAERALGEGRKIRLKPMPPAERREIHLALANFPGISTRSEGYDPARYVVVTPDGSDSDLVHESDDYWDDDDDI